MNRAKIKGRIFHTSTRVRAKCHLTLSHRPVEVVGSYVYLGVTFSACSCKFLMTQAGKDRLTRGYASLSLLERQCHQAYFQEPRTKGWFFDSLVTSSLMYASVVWAPCLPSLMSMQLERPLVTMLSCQLRSKSTVPHDIIRVEVTLPSMLVEALFQIVAFIHKIHSQPQDRISHQAFEASRSLYESGDN